MIMSIACFVLSVLGGVAAGSLLQAWGFWSWLKGKTPWGKSD
tara:strand:+ start:1185 stop:1310 length:126 start_codon:yes stop_codon:yes gene_type:complete